MKFLKVTDSIYINPSLVVAVTVNKTEMGKYYTEYHTTGGFRYRTELRDEKENIEEYIPNLYQNEDN